MAFGPDSGATPVASASTASWTSRLGLRSSFLVEHSAGGVSMGRRERVLSMGRLLFTLTAVLAVSLESSASSRPLALGYNLLIGHLAYAAGVLIWVSNAPRILPRHGILLHASDLLWAFALTITSGGPGSPIFLYFLFSVVAAAYRWGLVETLITTLGCILMIVMQYAVAVSPLSPNGLDASVFQVGRIVIRVGTLVATGFLLGYFGEQEKQLRMELAAKAAASRPFRVDGGVPGVATVVCEQLSRTLGAASTAIVIRQNDTGEVRMWRLDRSGSVATPAAGRSLGPDEQAAWLFETPGTVSHATQSRTGWTWRMVDQESWRLRLAVANRSPAPDVFQQFSTVTAASIGLSGEWTGRIYLFNLPADALARRLHFLQSLTDQISSAVTNAVLLQRLRSQATLAERARVARELHDGAIQSLLSLDLKIEALRRRPGGMTDESRTELGVVQTQLQREAIALRDLMRALRPINLDSREVITDAVASVVERFQRETSIPAEFAASGGTIVLQRSRAIELLRIVQEALVNVRKHSRARHVEVRLAKQEAGCVLVIEDDGRGFDFEGHLSPDELDRFHKGPVVLQERAQTMGAALSVYSKPGSGARLELRFAEDQHA